MSYVVLAGLIALCLGVGFAGSLATRQGLLEWYPSLRKPTWNPPSWVFAPVWTLLYVLMAVAAWLCWREVGIGYGYWMFVFGFQLLLNLAWSFIFFSARNVELAFFEVVALLVWIGVTVAVFSVITPVAAWLMVPYLLWVTFATCLNWKIWQLNKPIVSKTSGNHPI